MKTEITITDQRGTGTPIKRTVQVICADGEGGYIRSQSQLIGSGQPVPLNIDVHPELVEGGKIRLGFSLQYDWPVVLAEGEKTFPGGVTRTTLNDSISMVLEDGKSMVVAQSADPISERQVTVEVKATIVR